jgi:hypothetical protein
MLKKRFFPALSLFIFILIVSLFSTCNPPASGTYRALREYVDTIKVINTHEHQRIPFEYEGKKHNFYTLLAWSYLRADLISAGAPRMTPEIVNKGDLDELWKTYGPYLDFSRNTTYYSHFLAGFQKLYGYEEPYFTEEGVRQLSDQIEQNYNRREEWYQEAFEKSGFEVMLVDQYWNTVNTNLDNRYFALVFNINDLISAPSRRDQLLKGKTTENQNPYKRAENEGFPINTLDDYLAFAGHLFESFQEHNVLCLKNSNAYARSLDYENVPYERAKELYALPTKSLSSEQRKALVDFMFHWVIKKSIEAGLPIQIHTGYLAGNGNNLENGRPIKLNNLFRRYRKARFVLFHGGYPWTGEFGALGKMFPNVYLDLVWLPQISREAAVKALDEWFDLVPYNKFFWGGDCHYIEESVGSLEFAKDVVAQVLAARINRGLMTREVARDAALKIFRENAIRVFKLEMK